MFIKKDAKLIVDLLKNNLPKEILEDPDIIIAGGFALNAFMANEAIQSVSNIGMAEILLSSLSINPIAPYSDIDLWIMKDSSSGLLPLFQKMDIDTSVGFGDSTKFHVSRTSDWANTFTVSMPVFSKKVKIKPVQCIIRPQESPEDLIKSFDLGISSVAIYRGEFIVHENFFKSLEKKELITNGASAYKNKSLASRVFQALRHFKYYNKLNFDFSKELYQDVLNVMSDANQLWIEAQKAEIIDRHGSYGRLASQPNYLRGPVNSRSHVSGKVKITTSQNYEQEVDVKESLTGMIRGLAEKFPEMQKMKHWDISHALFLQDSPIIPVKSILEKSLANQELKKNSAQKETKDLYDKLAEKANKDLDTFFDAFNIEQA